MPDSSSCLDCGTPLIKRHSPRCPDCRKVHRRELERERDRRSGRHRGREPGNWTRPCGFCDRRFTDKTARKYCSDACRLAASLVRGDRMYGPTRREAPILASCEFCGVSMTMNQAKNRRHCSERCRHTSAGRYPTECAIRCGVCRRCGVTYCCLPSVAEGFCSARCNRRQQKSREKYRRRARLRTVTTENFTLREIAERDNWRCHLCGDKVPDREYAALDKDPTIDHLIPVSKGGEHTRANVALAHNRCNWERSDADVGFQLRLVG
jgi:hypothetical protein